jgi:16S rRNA processing protein RimM
MAAGDLLLVGRVARAHGNRGQVIVNLETDFAEERFRVGIELIVGPPGAGQARAIREVRFHQGRPIILLSGIDTMTGAETLAGADLWMPADAMEPLPDGTFYRHDLVGCEVRDLAGALLGRVSDVEGPLDRSLLVIEGGGGEAMIPMVAGICVRVDIGARLIVVNPPDGLLELNAPARREAGGNGRGR